MIFSKWRDIVLTRRQTVAGTSTLPGELNIFSQRLQPIFEVDVAITRDMFGFSFVPGFKLHPYAGVCAMLQSHSERRDELAFEVLKEFYLNFQPSTTIEAFSGQQTVGVGLKSFRLPWEELANERRTGANLGYCGPRTDAQARNEFERIKDVFYSIKNKGYNPRSGLRLQDSGHIEGYFLKASSNLCFVVVHGKHRLAALSTLGWKKIPVTFCVGRPRVVDVTNLSLLLQMPGQSMTEAEIALVVKSFFAGNEDNAA